MGYKLKRSGTFTPLELRTIEILNRAIAIFKERHNEYNAGGVKFEDMFPCGDQSHWTEINKRHLRLRSMVENNQYDENFLDKIIDDIVHLAAWGASKNNS